MRDKYVEQLKNVHDNLVIMGNLCEDAISLSIEAFLNGNIEFQKKAKVFEADINEMEKNIQQECMKLLLHQQPVAGDLREVSSALKMITDLERIGDQAYDIACLAGYSIESIEEEKDFTKEDLRNMARESVSMVKCAVESFVKNDLILAKQVQAYDDIVDDLFDVVKKDCVMDLKNERKNPEVVIDTLMVAKYLERIADHATNIGEWVEFLITGKHKEI